MRVWQWLTRLFSGREAVCDCYIIKTESLESMKMPTGVCPVHGVKPHWR